MPRKRAARGAKTTRATAKKTTEAVHETPTEVLEYLLSDLDAQVPRLIESSTKKYTRECQKAIRLLPDKSGLHPDVVNMPFEEFISRGGTFYSVMQSLRDEQLRPATDKVGQAQECQPLSTRATGQLCFRSQENVVDNALDLVTPTVPYRKVAVVPSTTKRKAKEMERLELEMRSQSTGSPVDEKKAMQELLLGTMKEAIARLPKRSQAQAERAFEEALKTNFGPCFTLGLDQLTNKSKESTTTLIVTPSVAHSASTTSVARSTRSNARRRK